MIRQVVYANQVDFFIRKLLFRQPLVFDNRNNFTKGVVEVKVILNLESAVAVGINYVIDILYFNCENTSTRPWSRKAKDTEDKLVHPREQRIGLGKPRISRGSCGGNHCYETVLLIDRNIWYKNSREFVFCNCWVTATTASHQQLIATERRGQTHQNVLFVDVVIIYISCDSKPGRSNCSVIQRGNKRDSTTVRPG